MSFDKEYKECFKSTSKYVFPEDKETQELWNELANDAADSFLYSLGRQTIFQDRDNPILRLSSLGKASIVEVLAKKFNLLKQGDRNTVNEQCRFRFIIGDIFECIFKYQIQRFGFEVIEDQRLVEWNGVSGHTDLIVRTPQGEECLLELKTANNRYFTQVKKYIGDERGYLTQLCTYQEATGLPAYWVFFNKDTQDVFIKPLEDVPESSRKKRLERAKKVIDIYNTCESWEDYPLFCVPPPAKIEKFKDGTFKVWDKGEYAGKPKLYVSFVTHPELYYKCEELKTDYGQKRTYVFGFNAPEKYRHKLPDIFEWSLHHAN